MGRPCVLLMLFVFCIGHIHSSTIKQIVETNAELSELKTYFKNFNSEHLSKTLASDSFTFTFFAPSNDAFARLSKEMRSSLQSSQGRQTFHSLMLYHTADFIPGRPQTALTSSYFTERAQGLSTMEGSRAYYMKNSQIYYINNARLTTTDIQASNGVIHIIDSLMSSVAVKESLFSYIENPQNTMFKEFLKLLQSYDQSEHQAVSCLRNDYRPSTVFAPTDEAFSRIPRGVLAQLKNSPDDLRKVVDSHVICEQVYHTTVINDTVPSPLTDALEGVLEPSLYGYDLYIRNNCVQGRLMPGSVTTSSGVLHPVDTVLGFRHNSLLEEIESRNDLSRFSGHIQSSNIVRGELTWQGLPGTEVPQEQIYTIFAATNAAMDGVDFTQQDIDNILHYHMVRGMYTTQDMQNNERRTTMGQREFSGSLAPLGVSMAINHNTGIAETFVEVNHVVGKILLGDICVKNGLLHIVDNVLGVPTEQSMDYMYNREDLGEFTRKINDIGLETDIDYKELTIFAPNNLAFERMRQTNIGTQLLSSDNVEYFRNAMLRHLVRGAGLILTDSNVPQNLRSEFDDIAVKKVGAQFFVTFNYDQDVLITQPNIRTKNAVIHIVDEVMFVDDVMALQVGRAGAVTVSTLLVSVSVCLWMM